MNTILQLAKEYAPYCRELKQWLHQHPELSFKEVLTCQRIRTELTELDITFIDIGLPTAVVCLLEGGLPGKTIALRADIDAIHLQEEPGNPGSSLFDGVMHACGHDFHTAALLGAAKILSSLRDQLKGNVVFLFQPAEEITQGAQSMLENGLLGKLPQPIDAIFGLHNRPDIIAGQIGVKRGALMAAQSSFSVLIQGKSGHGGMPHRCVDVIVPAASMIQAIQTIVSRNLDPFEPAVCGVCSINGGTEDNFIIDNLTFSGLIRTLSQSAHKMICERLRTIVEHQAAAYGCTAHVDIQPVVPLIFNGDEMSEIAYEAAIFTVGEKNVITPTPCLGSEDFSIFSQQIPSFFYWVGTGFADRENPEWHSPNFHTNDDALPIASALLAQSVLSAQDVGISK
jgi:hippurate hydrolase